MYATYALGLGGWDAAVVGVRAHVLSQVEAQQLHEQVGAPVPGTLPTRHHAAHMLARLQLPQDLCAQIPQVKSRCTNAQHGLPSASTWDPLRHPPEALFPGKTSHLRLSLHGPASGISSFVRFVDLESVLHHRPTRSGDLN